MPENNIQQETYQYTNEELMQHAGIPPVLHRMNKTLTKFFTCHIHKSWLTVNMTIITPDTTPYKTKTPQTIRIGRLTKKMNQEKNVALLYRKKHTNY